MIGSALVECFAKEGHIVTRIVRNFASKVPGQPSIVWNPEKKEINLEELDRQDAVIHLAGENIGTGRWTVKRKEKIRKSRLQGTSFLCENLVLLKHRPKVLFSASAIGYYGIRDNGAPVDEAGSSPSGFLPDLCRSWEEATKPATYAGIRVINLRFGVVLSPKGGALAKMLPVFKLGLGGKVGSGRQMMSWIALDEIPRIILYLINQDSIEGPVNVVSPRAVSNTEFTRILAKILSRPAIIPLPAFMVKIMFGKMGEDLLLGGANVTPKKLEEQGYSFAYPDLERALRHLLTRSSIRT